MEMNRIRITCDPYNETIKYEWYESGKRQDLSLSDRSVFSDDSFLKGSLSYKAIDIIQALIDNNYCNDNGLVIEFVGTDDDYESLDGVIATYFSEKNIELEKCNKYIINASNALPTINAELSKLENMLEENKNETLTSLLRKYTDTIKPEIAICIMGLYSSGKSTFINSLLGKEILPSASNPETAKIYKISNSKSISVTFEYENKDCVVSFTNKQWKYDKNAFPDVDLFISVDSLFKTNDIQGAENKLFYFLKALNEYAATDGKQEHKKIGAVIDVKVPFGKTYLPLDKYEFVIYDTPGTNSASNPEHFKALENSLKEQNSGLPVLVSTPNSMDDESYKALIEKQNKFGKSLDLANLIVVVNKSDMVANEDLKKINISFGKVILTENECKNLYFVSSVAGLGGKKQLSGTEKEWLDKTYRKAYKNLKDDFCEKDEEDYTQLYTFNVIPKNIKNKTIQHKDVNLDKSLILWNSGIPSVELGIENFAEKFALYNKCNQAKNVLAKLVAELDQLIKSKKEDCQDRYNKINEEMGEYKSGLISKLESLEKTILKELQENFSNNVTTPLNKKYLGQAKQQADVGIILDLKSQCSGKRGKDKVSQFNAKLTGHYRQECNSYIKDFIKVAEKYWDGCKNELQKAMAKIVLESDDLTDEEKEKLSSEIKYSIYSKQSDYQFDEKQYLSVKKFLFFEIKTNRIDASKVQQVYTSKLNEFIFKINSKNSTKSKKALTDYYRDVLLDCKMSIATLNPKLKEKNEELVIQKTMLETYERQKIEVKNCRRTINTLLNVKEK